MSLNISAAGNGLVHNMKKTLKSTDTAVPRNPFRAVKSKRRWINAIRTDPKHIIALDRKKRYVGNSKKSGTYPKLPDTYWNAATPSMKNPDSVDPMEEIL
mmetsp:Transcript_17018/g.23956  ORF Transcript_17018/g.23956 Transcript_17018/m.23956 type:complete len:100 (+) Transcript_17018:627-926(+)